MARRSFLATTATLLFTLIGFTTAVNESISYGYYVEPTSFTSAERISHCASQTDTCLKLCPQGLQLGSPFCDQTTLMWDCECAGTPTPNITHFNNTIPFFQCQEYVAQCQTENTQNATAQHKCLAIQCGGLNATAYVKQKYGSTTTSSMTHKPTSKSGSGGQSNQGGGSSGGGGGGGISSGGGGGSGGGSGAAGLELWNSFGLAMFIGISFLFFTFGISL